MKKAHLLLALFVFVTGMRAQEEDERGETTADRIQNGGWFENSKWRRGADGSLEMHFFADLGGSLKKGQDLFVPVLGEQLEKGFHNTGAIGFLSLVCHGNGDLLSMTDADYHFGALGVDASDVGLRQFLAVPPPSFEGQRGRAELLDRLLAISVLIRRNCKSALGEFRALAGNEKLPAALREGAERAIVTLSGGTGTMSGQTTGTQRKQLNAATLKLPAAFDGCIVINHALLPDLGWLTPLGRRVAAMLTAQKIVMAGSEPTPAMLNGAQSVCDLVSEFPFGVAHQFGNARLDQSMLVIAAKADAQMPVSVSWQVAGEFEAELWQKAELPDGAAKNSPIFAGQLEVAADHVLASTDGSVGKPRPTMVEKLGLLDVTDCAIRAIVPGNSKVWPALAFLQTPSAEGAELRITFGDPCVITLQIDTRDEETAEALVAVGQQMVAQAREMLAKSLPAVWRESGEVKELLDAFSATQWSSEDETTNARLEVKGVTPAKIRVIANQYFIR